MDQYLRAAEICASISMICGYTDIAIIPGKIRYEWLVVVYNTGHF